MLVVVLVLPVVAGWGGYQISLGENQVPWGWVAGVAVVLFLVLVTGFVVNPAKPVAGPHLRGALRGDSAAQRLLVDLPADWSGTDQSAHSELRV